ncbi:unnamed protein product [Owenia fusiformis]|uniref:Uncharacterized protein n=1 Tax=Owenia fusiformis TaxID=6347 RepID=A0A8J1TGT1_OWEFU|nr:unnamed protein product [Owenia fusiformis]
MSRRRNPLDNVNIALQRGGSSRIPNNGLQDNRVDPNPTQNVQVLSQPLEGPSTAQFEGDALLDEATRLSEESTGADSEEYVLDTSNSAPNTTVYTSSPVHIGDTYINQGDAAASSSKHVTYMDTPMVLLEQGQGDNLVVHQETLEVLRKISKPMVVMAIVGPYRYGKSFLGNNVMKTPHNKGFEVGSSLDAKTKGIWIFAKEHPKRRDWCLVLLDTEGLHDATPEAGGKNYENNIFALSILLCNIFVLNHNNRIDQKAIEDLDFITDITKYIVGQKTKRENGGEDQSEDDLDSNDPYHNVRPAHLAWILRDFYLQPEIDGRIASPDEYLEHCLKTKLMPTTLRDRSVKQKIDDYNFPREQIVSMFPKRRCFVMCRPAADSKLQTMVSLERSDLDPKFVEQMDEFIEFAYNCEPKALTIDNKKIRIDGLRFASLVEEYSALKTPDVERAIVALTKKENDDLIERCAKEFEDSVRHIVEIGSPKPSRNLKITIGKKTHEKLLLFQKNKMNDDEDKFEDKLKKRLLSLEIKYVNKNEEHIKNKCETYLRDAVKRYKEIIESTCRFPVPRETLLGESDKISNKIKEEFCDQIKKFDMDETFSKKLESELKKEAEHYDTQNNSDDQRIRLEGHQKIDGAQDQYRKMMEAAMGTMSKAFTDSEMDELHDNTFKSVREVFEKEIGKFYDKKSLLVKLEGRILVEFDRFISKNNHVRQTIENEQTSKTLKQTHIALEETKEKHRETAENLNNTKEELSKTKLEQHKLKKKLDDQTDRLDEEEKKRANLEQANKQINEELNNQKDQLKMTKEELAEKMTKLDVKTEEYEKAQHDMQEAQRQVEDMKKQVEYLYKSQGVFRLKLKSGESRFVMAAKDEDTIHLIRADSATKSPGDLWKIEKAMNGSPDGPLGFFIRNHHFDLVLDCDIGSGPAKKTPLCLRKKDEHERRLCQIWIFKAEKINCHIKNRENTDLVLEGDDGNVGKQKPSVYVTQRSKIDLLASNQKWSCAIAHDIVGTFEGIV